MDIKGTTKENQLRLEIRKEFSNITNDDFLYFAKDTADVLSDMGLPVKDCIINSNFIDANEPKFYRLEHCLKNCGLKCLRNKKYNLK